MLKSYLMTLLIAMVPVVELRGAIPYGTLICDPPVPLLQTYLLAIIGNLIPVPFIFRFARGFLEWGSRKRLIGSFCSWCLRKGHHAGVRLTEKSSRGLYFALLLFVAIPIPGTGAWTGTLGASFLDMNYNRSILAVTLGVILSGLIIAGLSAVGINILR